MFDIPMNEIIKYNISLENNQLNDMWDNFPHIDNVSHKTEWYNAMVQMGEKQDVFVGLHQLYDNQTHKVKEYLLICSDRLSLKNLKDNNYKDFPKWLKWNRHQDRGTCLLDKVVIDISDIDRHNFLARNSYIMRYIQNIGIVKAAFLNQGFPLPDHVSDSVVTSIWELDHMRTNNKVPYELHQSFVNNYKNAIAKYAQMYANKYNNVLKDLPIKNSHFVDEDYFKKNHIPCNWDSINNELWQYIKNELNKGRFPEFICYKAKTPYLVTKDLSKKYDSFSKKCEKKGWFNIPNFWEKDKEIKEYYIAYPTSQEKIMGTLINEYNSLNCVMEVPLDTLMQYDTPETPLQYIEMNLHDLNNWESCCKQDGVQWALDDGRITKRELDAYSSLERIPIVYKFEDINNVSNITNAMARGILEYIPTSDKTKEETENRHNKEFYESLKDLDLRTDEEKALDAAKEKEQMQEEEKPKKKFRGLKL